MNDYGGMNMAIRCDATKLYPLVFRMDTPRSSYVFGISAQGYAVHLYYGARLSDRDTEAVCNGENSPWFPARSGQTLLDHVPLEYSGSGMADLRPAALSVLWDDGDNIADLRYKSHRLTPGAPASRELPHVYAEDGAEAQTLIVTLEDQKGIEVDLFYTIFADSDAVIRRSVIRNCGSGTVCLQRVMSASEDLPDCRMELLHLHGNWAHEFQVERLPVGHCEQRIGSFRGASGHQHNPFAAIVSPDCTETAGQAYGFGLIYSGNFCIETDVDAGDRLRVNAGLSDRAFNWPLGPGEKFETPEAVLVYSGTGLGDMSRTYHRLYAKYVCRGYWRDRPRPVLLNTWESMYFDVDREKLLRLARVAAKVGVELFVVDDGWFGHRSDDTTSLGDWTPWEEKLGCSLPELADDINRLGMGFGIWVEPEMVSPDSDLFRNHPDWVLCRPNRRATLARTQLILDLSRRDVQDFILETMTGLFAGANISYVKWDMNRNMTEIGSALDRTAEAGTLAHRYMMGLYRILDELTARFPKILFESCASGGGRFDAGMLYYMPQTWTSDDTDAAERLSIQGGASLAYPPSMMSCHVSAVPNHQIGRVTPLSTRWNVAVLGGGFGYELNLEKVSPEDLETIRRQIAQYRRERDSLFGSSFYRLDAPGGTVAFQQISEDGSRAVVTCCRKLAVPNEEPLRLRLQGLKPGAFYRCAENGIRCTGAALMGMGVRLHLPNTDFASERLRFDREETGRNDI